MPSGRIVVDIMGPGGHGYQYEAETQETEGEGAEAIAEGTGFDWFYDSLAPGLEPGRYLIAIEYTYYPAVDFWDEADEDIEILSCLRVAPDYSLETRAE